MNNLRDYRIFLNQLSLFAVLLGAWLILAKVALAQQKQLSLVVNAPGSPPHLYFNAELGDYVGVIPDLLAFAGEQHRITVTYVDSNRGRNEYLVTSGKFDLFYSSLAWVDNPSEFIATDPIFNHTSYLYSDKPFPKDFVLNNQTKASVCTRRGFTYPTLDVFFAQGNLKRIDSTSHHTMLNMLILGRCDMAELNRQNAIALFESSDYKHLTFYRLDPPTSIVPAVLVLHPSKVVERDLLNSSIRAFIADGGYEKSLAKHIKIAKQNTH